MNSTVGFAVYGSPVRLEVKANGLIEQLGLDPLFYFSGLSGDVLLEQGDSAFVVLKHRGPKQEYIRIVAYFEFARSYGQDRPGGFLGAAVCFKEFPHEVLLTKTIFEMIGRSRKLIDQASKFLAPDKTGWNMDLPEASNAYNTNSPRVWLPRELENGRSLGPLNLDRRARYVCSLQGGYEHQLKDLVESIIINPQCQELETVILTNSEGLINKFKQKGTAFLSAETIYDCTSLIAMKKRELYALGVKVSESRAVIEKLGEEKESLDQKLIELDTKKAELLNYLKEIQGTVEATKESKTRLEEDKARLRENLDQIKNDHAAYFSEKKPEFLKEFKQEIEQEAEKRVRESHRFRQLESELEELNSRKESYRIKQAFWKACALVLGCITVLLAAYFFWMIYQPKTDQREIVIQQLSDDDRLLFEILKKEPCNSFDRDVCRIDGLQKVLQKAANNTYPEPIIQILLQREWRFAELVGEPLDSRQLALDTTLNGRELFGEIASLNQLLEAGDHPFQYGQDDTALEQDTNEYALDAVRRNLFLLGAQPGYVIAPFVFYKAKSAKERFEEYTNDSTFKRSIYRGVFKQKPSVKERELMFEHFIWMALSLNENKLPEDAVWTLPQYADE